jgi:hypothetical protein
LQCILSYVFVLLQVGDGSYAPLLDVPPGKFSFYYLELALEARLQKKGQLYPWLLQYLNSSLFYGPDQRGMAPAEC